MSRQEDKVPIPALKKTLKRKAQEGDHAAEIYAEEYAYGYGSLGYGNRWVSVSRRGNKGMD